MAPAKRPWFRLYVETFTDTEIRAMAPAHRWAWVAVMGLARQSPVAGVLLDKAGDPVTEAALADFAAVKVADLRAAVKRFATLGMVRRDDNGALVVTNWDRRQFESDDVTTRTARHRASKSTDGTVEGTPDGTFQPPPHGTVSPSVVLTEIQRTDLDSSSSSEPLSRPAGPEENPISGEVWRLLAQFDAEAYTAKGGKIKSRAWFTTAAETRRTVHEAELRTLMTEHDDWTPQQLAQAITDGQTSGVLAQDDKAVAAMRARIDITERRKRGEVCPDCDDRGVAELEDGSFVDCQCKTRRAS